MDQFILTEQEAKEIIKKLDFSKLNGLIAVITQDIKTNKVVMVAFANDEAVLKTLTTGFAHYWSRSRNTLWKKGGTSGHLQIIKEIYVDCDQDALLLKIEQTTAACHTGYFSCFYRKIVKGKLETVGEKVFEPEK
ncbi:MAG: phosphoribosyl-AMP cyclohydrolase [Candidatus Helarchaeota archaeon]